MSVTTKMSSLVCTKTKTRNLHNSDIKKLVRILQAGPCKYANDQDPVYRKQIKEDIHNLPHRLRNSLLNLLSTNLCSLHKHLDSNLMNDIWAWLRHEMEGAIGKFLYPLLVSKALTEVEELKVRQLEPVMEMWQSDFDLEQSPPPGRYPINRGIQWAYQYDQCPACMCSRIGSCESTLFALFAGMVGRMPSKIAGTDVLRGIIGIDDIKSKRLRFVRYWIKASCGGDDMLIEAAELGLKMKILRLAWKKEKRQHHAKAKPRPIHTGRSHHRHHKSDRSDEVGDQDVSSPGYDLSVPFQQKDWTPETHHDDKLGPRPRPVGLSDRSPAAPMGFHTLYEKSPMLHGEEIHRPSSSSRTTVYPGSSVSVCFPPLNIQKLPKMAQADHVARVVESDDNYCMSRQSRHATIIITADNAHDSRGGKSVTQEDVCDDLSTYEGPSFLPHKRRIVSSDSIYSCDTFDMHKSTVVGIQDPLDSPFYNTSAMRDQMTEIYRELLKKHPALEEEEDTVDDQILPKPQRKSMYFAYTKQSSNVDEFEIVDEDDTGSSPPISPMDQDAGPSQRPGSATITRNRLY